MKESDEMLFNKMLCSVEVDDVVVDNHGKVGTVVKIHEDGRILVSYHHDVWCEFHDSSYLTKVVMT